jgi:hypothetical protein
MLSQSFKDLIERTLNGIKDELIREMDSGGFNASGRTKESFQVQAQDFYGELIGLRSFQTIVAERLKDGGRGRGPTKSGGNGELYKSILQWIQEKGITPEGITIESLAFLISRKIHREGTAIYRGEKQGIDLKGIATRYIDQMMKEIPMIIITNLKQNANNSNQ